jgi:hypothetical protein
VLVRSRAARDRSAAAVRQRNRVILDEGEDDSDHTEHDPYATDHAAFANRSSGKTAPSTAGPPRRCRHRQRRGSFDELDASREAARAWRRRSLRLKSAARARERAPLRSIRHQTSAARDDARARCARRRFSRSVKGVPSARPSAYVRCGRRLDPLPVERVVRSLTHRGTAHVIRAPLAADFSQRAAKR